MLLSTTRAYNNSQKQIMCSFLTTRFQPLKANADYSVYDRRLVLAWIESPLPTNYFLKRSRETANQNRNNWFVNLMNYTDWVITWDGSMAPLLATQWGSHTVKCMSSDQILPPNKVVWSPEPLHKHMLSAWYLSHLIRQSSHLFRVNRISWDVKHHVIRIEGSKKAIGRSFRKILKWTKINKKWMNFCDILMQSLNCWIAYKRNEDISGRIRSMALMIMTRSH